MQVLQRKTEEAAMATKRLKELLESRKSSPRENSGKLFTFSFTLLWLMTRKPLSQVNIQHLLYKD